MERIHTNDAPAAIGPYCQAMVHNGMVYTSGQLSLDPVSGALLGSNVQEQAEQACKNLSAVLKAANSSMEHVIKTTCFLANIEDFQAFNAVYEKYFVSKPARSCVAVKTLPKNALVEIEVIAHQG